MRIGNERLTATAGDGDNNDGGYNTPEQKLMAAMLVRAAVDYSASNVRPIDKKSASLWLNSASTSVISFEMVCEVLYLDAEITRTRILTLGEKAKWKRF